jgi:phenylpropionate dioxygenase-like ring-hydroxylating dioxygenase large terminal subunit
MNVVENGAQCVTGSCGLWGCEKPGIEDKGWYFVCTFRDLDHVNDTGMENLVDPSHVPVAHHGVNGGVMGKREMASPIQLEVTAQHPRGFEGKWNKPHGGQPSRHVFDAPARFTYRFFLKQPGAAGCTTTYCTPMGTTSLLPSSLPHSYFSLFASDPHVPFNHSTTDMSLSYSRPAQSDRTLICCCDGGAAPGRCRILVINARNFMTQLSSGPEWWQLFPRWLDHQMMLNIFDGDLTLLHEQVTSADGVYLIYVLLVSKS